MHHQIFGYVNVNRIDYGNGIIQLLLIFEAKTRPLNFSGCTSESRKVAKINLNGLKVSFLSRNDYVYSYMHHQIFGYVNVNRIDYGNGIIQLLLIFEAKTRPLNFSGCTSESRKVAKINLNGLKVSFLSRYDYVHSYMHNQIFRYVNGSRIDYGNGIIQLLLIFEAKTRPLNFSACTPESRKVAKINLNGLKVSFLSRNDYVYSYMHHQIFGYVNVNRIDYGNGIIQLLLIFEAKTRPLNFSGCTSESRKVAKINLNGLKVSFLSRNDYVYSYMHHQIFGYVNVNRIDYGNLIIQLLLIFEAKTRPLNFSGCTSESRKVAKINLNGLKVSFFIKI